MGFHVHTHHNASPWDSIITAATVVTTMPAPPTRTNRRRPGAPASQTHPLDSFASPPLGDLSDSELRRPPAAPRRRPRSMSNSSSISGALDSPEPPIASDDPDEDYSDEDLENEGGSNEDDISEISESNTTTASSSARNPNNPSSGSSSSASLRGLKEIGNLASWTVSTAKPGNSIPQLRSDDLTEFWQSDGPQPHYINIHFAKRVRIARIRLYLDFENDESYTPTRMCVVAGTGYHDLSEVAKVELERPNGWVEVPLGGVHEDGELRTWLVQLQVLANHQNGKDTHIRGFQVFARETERGEVGGIGWTSQRMLEELEVR